MDGDVTATLLAIAARQPDAPFLSAPGRRTMRWSSVADHIARVRRDFHRWDIRRGDVVVASSFDRHACAAALAILPAASTFALLADGTAPGRCAELLRRMRARAVLVAPRPAGACHPLELAARELRIARIRIEPRTDAETGAFDLALEAPDRSLDTDHAGDARHGWIGVTSGTTGRPKLVSHGHRQVIATAMATGKRLAMTPRDVSGHLTPLSLANGQRTAFLLSLLNGGSVHCLPEAGADALLDAVDADAVSYVSCSFTIHRELLALFRSGRRVRSSRLRFVRVASGALEPPEMDALEAAFGVPVVTGLGATETGMVAHQHLPPSPRKRGSVGRPLACDLRLVDEAGREVPPGALGAIEVRGPQLFDGYLDDPDLDARSFAGGWFRMGDLGWIDEDGELHIAGRLAETINRGGEKISPAEIDAVLLSLAGVADAAAFGLPHPTLGEEVVAAVVRSPDGTVTGSSVQEHVRAALGSRRTPRQVWFVGGLPRNAAGKLLRAGLPAWVGAGGAAPSTDTGHGGGAPPAPNPSLTPAEAALARLWCGLLGVSAVSPEDTFRSLGGDPARARALAEQVRAAFGVECTDETVASVDATLGEMALAIRRCAGGA